MLIADRGFVLTLQGMKFVYRPGVRIIIDLGMICRTKKYEVLIAVSILGREFRIATRAFSRGRNNVSHLPKYTIVLDR